MDSIKACVAHRPTLCVAVIVQIEELNLEFAVGFTFSAQGSALLLEAVTKAGLSVIL